MRQRTCPNCKEKFTPFNSFQKYCFKNECIREWNRVKKEKTKRKAKKELNENDIRFLKRRAQEVFNRYIRKRDEGKPCISCGYTGTSRQWHASHYRPVGRNSKHRFNEMNVHSACSICNSHLSGNLVPYRAKLIGMYGVDAVIELENDNETKKWTKEELKEVISEYTKKEKQISNGM